MDNARHCKDVEESLYSYSCIQLEEQRNSSIGKAIWIRNGRRRLTVEVNEGLDRPGPEVAGGLERGVLGDVRHDEPNGRAAPVRPVDLLPHPVHPGQHWQGRRRRARQ